MVAVTWGRVRRELDNPGITVVDKTTGIIRAAFFIDPTKAYQRKIQGLPPITVEGPEKNDVAGHTGSMSRYITLCPGGDLNPHVLANTGT